MTTWGVSLPSAPGSASEQRWNPAAYEPRVSATVRALLLLAIAALGGCAQRSVRHVDITWLLCIVENAAPGFAAGMRHASDGVAERENNDTE